ncbi:hypothetical protein [Wukongibacter sp. M2B1]|uniref:hypothetical protein n=1 Tax=Wukongibacter sp. M2B1 TaxID=3088895 RepID=UPI003D796668
MIEKPQNITKNYNMMNIASMYIKMLENLDVNIYTEIMVVTTVTLIRERIDEDREISKKVIILSELIIRESCKRK